MSGDPLSSWERDLAPWVEPSVAPAPAKRSLRVAIGRASDAVMVTVGGKLDADGSEVLGDTLRDLVDGQGNLFLVVDLQDTVVGDPGALEVLTTTNHSLESRGGRLLLANAAHETHDALRAAGLGAAIEIHPERRHHPSTRHRPQG